MNQLVLDIGNTDLVLGYWGNDKTDPNILRISSKDIINNINIITPFLSQARHDFNILQPRSITLSSVVPVLTSEVVRAVQQAFGQEIKVLNKDQFHKLPLVILRPDQIGTDLVANALAAYTLFSKDCIIVDFGTALSFTTVSASGNILGVAIAPGIKTALHSLTVHAAQLQDVPLIMPDSSLGQDTEHAIQAGIMYGYDGLVRGIIHVQEKELNKKLFIIATGGLSKKIHTLRDAIHQYQPFLTIEGLRIAGELI